MKRTTTLVATASRGRGSWSPDQIMQYYIANTQQTYNLKLLIMLMANIRYATINDLPAIVRIYNTSIPSHMATADLEPVSVSSRRGWFEFHSPNKHPIWVIEVNNVVAGWLSFQAFYGRSAYDGTAEISIYIASEYHRQGLAKQLLAKAIKYSPNLGLQNLLAFIFGHNHPSLSLFEQFGFQTWGKLPKVALMDGVEYDLIIMGLRVE